MNNKPLLIVDIQPTYVEFVNQSICLNSFSNYINSFKNDIFYMFNGEEIDCDTLEDIKKFLFDIGVHLEVIENITFIEKTYGWIREEMDVMDMLECAVEDKLASGEVDYSFYYFEDIPNDVIICGGAEQECLREVELTMDFLNKSYEQNEEFIYF